MWTVSWYISVMAMMAVCQYSNKCLAMRPPLPSEMIARYGDSELSFSEKKSYHDKQKHPRVEAIKNNLIPEVKEYYVEHEISESSARREAKEMTIESNPDYSVGCEECTDEEMDYCLGPGIIDDHCCCDGRFLEYFPYIPHTCYGGTTLCKPVRTDCEEYVRIRDCCCRAPLAAKWKTRLLGGSSSSNELKISIYSWHWILSWILIALSA